MLPTWIRKLRSLSRRLWIRVVLVASLGVVALLGVKLLDPLVPAGFADEIGADALGDLLDIIATSMLAVTTFSLSVMVSVHRSAAAQLTHRAQETLRHDTTTQTVLATFIGAWVYALTAIILIYTPFFGEKEIVALFATTILILLLIVFSMFRWMVHLHSLGSLHDTAKRMEVEAIAAIRERPALNAHRLEARGAPPGGTSILAARTGFVQVIYEDRLQEAAAAANARLWVLALPGTFVQQGQEIARLDVADEVLARGAAEHIRIGDRRTAEQDPGFGLIQLSEIGSKALSPGINDPGTAIDVLGRMARVLRAWKSQDGRPPRHDRLWLTAVDAAELVSKAFDPIARDGASLVEVQVALQDRLAGLIAHADPELRPAIEATASRAQERALAALSSDHDRSLVVAAAGRRIRG